jgi:hypothetical protein
MDTERAHWGRLRAARGVSVLALIAIGADHLYEYSIDHYSAIPTTGRLFLLNAVGAFSIAAALVLPLRHVMSHRRASRLTGLIAASGVGLALSTLAGLIISEHTPLFGFMEHGYRTSIVIAIAAEVTASGALAILLASAMRSSPRTRSRAIAAAALNVGSAVER